MSHLYNVQVARGKMLPIFTVGWKRARLFRAKVNVKSKSWLDGDGVWCVASRVWRRLYVNIHKMSTF